jgi:hypothetical protein
MKPSLVEIFLMRQHLVISSIFFYLCNDRFGSLAVVHPNFSPMTALGWKADTQPGRMSAFTNTGRSEPSKSLELNGS